MPLKSRKCRWDSTEKTVSAPKVKAVADRVKIIDDEESTTPENQHQTIIIQEKEKEVVSAEQIQKITQTSGIPFKPFASNKEKQSRYEKYLAYRKLGLKGGYFILDLNITGSNFYQSIQSLPPPPSPAGHMSKLNL